MADRKPGAEGDLSIRLTDVSRRLHEEPTDIDLIWERIATLWLIGVDDEAGVDAGLDALDTLESSTIRAGPEAAARLVAYRGAFEALLGKHALWPHEKLGHVRIGLRLLDDAVADSPRDLHARYLRLMTSYYLPGVFGRADEVRADFDMLTSILPDARSEFPAELYREVVNFVLENGNVGAERRAALESAIETV